MYINYVHSTTITYVNSISHIHHGRRRGISITNLYQVNNIILILTISNNMGNIPMHKFEVLIFQLYYKLKSIYDVCTIITSSIS